MATPLPFTSPVRPGAGAERFGVTSPHSGALRWDWAAGVRSPHPSTAPRIAEEKRVARLLSAAARRATRDYASRVSPQAKREATARLWELQDGAQRLTPHAVNDRTGYPSSIRKCRRVRIAEMVELRVRDGRAHAAGLSTCRSVWECPCCLRRVRGDRASTVREAVQTWHGWGGASYLATFTIRHGWSDRLGETLHGLSRAWQDMQRGKAWQNFTKHSGVQSIRSIEITHGKNGWHPHIHAVFLTPAELPAKEKHRVQRWLSNRWQACVSRALGEAFVPDDAHGTDFRALEIDDYICKIGAELTDAGGKKRAKKGNRTPFEILASACGGDPADEWLWKEYARASKGTRFLTWSRGLRGLREMAELAAKNELQAEAAEEVVAAAVSAADWDRLRDLPDFRCQLLLAATVGRTEVYTLLADYRELAEAVEAENRARAGPV